MPELLFPDFSLSPGGEDGTDSMETPGSMETPDSLGTLCAPCSQQEEFLWSQALGSNRELPGLLQADPGGAGGTGIVDKSLGAPQASLS